MRHLVLECFFYAWTNLSEFGERIGRDSVYTANRSHRFSFFQSIYYFKFVIDEYFQFGDTSLFPTENDSFCFSSGKSFFGSHRYKVPFDFCDKTECKAKDFAVYGIIECVSVFGRVDCNIFFKTFSHNGHNLCESAA